MVRVWAVVGLKDWVLRVQGLRVQDYFRGSGEEIWTHSSASAQFNCRKVTQERKPWIHVGRGKQAPNPSRAASFPPKGLGPKVQSNP